MQPIVPFDPSAATSGTFKFTQPNGGWLAIINESPIGVLLVFGDASQKVVPPNFLRVMRVNTRLGDVAWSKQYSLPVSQAPISTVFGECYDPAEWTGGEQLVPLPRQINVGNPPVGGVARTLVDDLDPVGTQFIEATPLTQGFSSWNFAVDASGFLQVLSANVARKVINVTRGDTLATKAIIQFGDANDTSISTFYGSLDRLRADGGKVLTDGNGNITLDNGGADSPNFVMNDAVHNTHGYLDLQGERLRLIGSYRGGGEGPKFTVGIQFGDLSFDGGNITSSGTGDLTIANNSTQTPHLGFKDGNNTQAQQDLKLDRWRVNGSYRGGGFSDMISIGMQNKDVSLDGGAITTDGAGKLTIAKLVSDSAKLTTDGLGNITLDNATASTPQVVMNDAINNTHSALQQSSERVRLTGSYRGAATAVLMSIGIQNGDLSIDAGKITSDGAGNLTIASGGALNTPRVNLQGTLSASNKTMDLQQGYQFFSDNTDSLGTTRLWYDGPDRGAVHIGPRSSLNYFDWVRLRATRVTFDLGKNTSPNTIFFEVTGGKTQLDNNAINSDGAGKWHAAIIESPVHQATGGIVAVGGTGATRSVDIDGSTANQVTIGTSDDGGGHASGLTLLLRSTDTANAAQTGVKIRPTGQTRIGISDTGSAINLAQIYTGTDDPATRTGNDVQNGDMWWNG